ASASTYCYGEEGTGLDPASTVCAEDAINIGSMALHGGQLDLRWSANCNAAWGHYSTDGISGAANALAETGVTHARVTVWNPGEQSQGQVGESYGFVGGSWWSAMVTGEKPTQTCVELVTQAETLDWAWGPTTTSA